MVATQSDVVLVERRGAVALITLNRPERLNAITWEMWARLREAEAEFVADPALAVAVITGAGDRAFCAGMDLKEYLQHREAGEVSWRRMSSLLPGLTEHDKPLIAAINGPAFGGGLEVALACDIRVMADTARLALPEVKKGFYPATAVFDLPRQTSRATAMYLTLTGAEVDAAEALRLGLVQKVVPAREALPCALRMAEEMAQSGPLALAAAKRLIRAGSEMTAREARHLGEPLFDRVYNSEDAREGAASFAEKRAPVFRGR